MTSDWTYDPRDSRGVDSSHGEYGVFTVTNFASGLSLDCNANNDLLTADTLATLIKILIEKGIIGGSVN